MKKITFVVLAIFLSLSLHSYQSYAAVAKDITPATTGITKQAEQAQVKALELRLTEIKDMDMSELKTAEKRELRKEVRSIKKQISELGGGVYISVGAIIIILLLVIILL